MQKQIAVLLTFPPGVSKTRAEEIARSWERLARSPAEEPQFVEAKEFNSQHGGITIYQP